MRRFGSLAFSALLVGCAAAQPIEESIPQPVIAAPVAIKTILAERGRLFKDPDSIRDAHVGEPYACRTPTIASGGRIVNAPGSCVCLELNAKNSYGGYVGMRRTIAVFPDSGGITSMDGGIKGYEEYCRGVRPFPELNGKAR